MMKIAVLEEETFRTTTRGINRTANSSTRRVHRTVSSHSLDALHDISASLLRCISFLLKATNSELGTKGHTATLPPLWLRCFVLRQNHPDEVRSFDVCFLYGKLPVPIWYLGP